MEARWVGLLLGFMGLAVHSLLSIWAARIRTQRRYRFMEYFREYDCALGASAIIMIGLYIIGLHNLAIYADGWIPPVIIELAHQSEDYRPIWFLIGMAQGQVWKSLQLWFEK